MWIEQAYAMEKENFFDKLYEIEAFCHQNDMKETLIEQIKRGTFQFHWIVHVQRLLECEANLNSFFLLLNSGALNVIRKMRSFIKTFHDKFSSA